MSPLHIARIALAAKMTLPPLALERHLPCPPSRIGEELAHQVHEYVLQQALGYYPALGFFQVGGGIDPALLDAAEQTAWLASRLLQEEVLVKLRAAFSTVRFEASQAIAFTLPLVRPGQADALPALARHYTPDTLRVELLLSLVQRTPDTGSTDKLAEHLVMRWLAPSLRSLEITAARVLK